MTAALRGANRVKTANELRARYESGDSIRGIAFATGHSYCRVRNLLLEAGTALRPPGLRRGAFIRAQ